MSSRTAAVLLVATAVNAMACRHASPPPPSATEPEPVVETTRPAATNYRAVEVGNGGSVRGRVIWEGASIAIPAVTVGANGNPAVCGATQIPPVLSVNAAGGVQFAVVSLTGITQGKAATPAEQLVDQRACQYTPHVIATTLSAGVRFTSSDANVLHTVNGVYGYRAGETWFNRATPRGVSVVTQTEREGVSTILCNAGHPWMLAFVHAFTHPYFATSNENGEFVLENVPPGTYPLHFWHEGFTAGAIDANDRPTYGPAVQADATVTVTPGATTNVDFVLGPSGVRAAIR